MRWLPAGEDMNTESEEYTFLGATAQQQLVKINWEDIMRAVVRSDMHELARAIELYVITIYKYLRNPIINPNPMYYH
jgi:hypothetical protein